MTQRLVVRDDHDLAGDDGRIWAVDNGLTFHDEPKLRTVIWDFATEAVPGDLLAAAARVAADGGPSSLDELVVDDERAALVRRAGGLVNDGAFPADLSGRCYPWPLV